MARPNCFVLAGILYFSGFAVSGAPGERAPIGLNLDVTEQTLINLTDYARIIDAGGQDAHGWPTSDFSLLLDNRYIFAWEPGNPNIDPLAFTTNLAGHYKLSFTGKAITYAKQNGGLLVRDPVYDRAKNQSTVEFDLDDPLIEIKFIQTRRTSEGKSDSGVSGIRLVRTDAPQAESGIFTKLWLDSIRNYKWSVLRCMEAMKINSYGFENSREAYPNRLNWATDRRLPGTGPLYGELYPGVHGSLAWEDLVVLAQLTRRDLWINIPVNASDDYVDQLALLFKNGNAATGNAGIPSEVNLYVEYANELWHEKFASGRWNIFATQAEVKAGATNLNYDGAAGSSKQWRFRRMAKRTIEIGQQFRKVFQGQPDRIRPVVNNHLMENTFDMLQYVTANYGRPASVLYGISQTGYFTSTDASSAEKVLAGQRIASDRNRKGYLLSRMLATYFGLHSLVYEGGPDEKGGKEPAVVDKGLPNKFAATRDPRTKDVVLHDLVANWFPSGGELYLPFSQVTRYSYYGMYGLTEDLSNLETGKWLGYVAATEMPLPPVTAGTLLSATPGQTMEPRANPDAVEKEILPGPAPWAMFLLRVPLAGTYMFTLRGKPKGPEHRLRFMIDNADAGSIALTDANANAGNVTASLAPGLHSLFIFLDGTHSVTLAPAAPLVITTVNTGPAGR